MSNLHRHLCLTGSLLVSSSKLVRFFMEAAVGDHVTVALRPAVLLPDLGVEVVLRRDVIVTFAGAPSGTIAWAPSDDGPFPRMSGELHVVADSEQSSRLVLTGDVEANRSMIGHRFNQAVARDFLQFLAERLG